MSKSSCQPPAFSHQLAGGMTKDRKKTKIRAHEARKAS
jgi:hypothetical protein